MVEDARHVVGLNQDRVAHMAHMVQPSIEPLPLLGGRHPSEPCEREFRWWRVVVIDEDAEPVHLICLECAVRFYDFHGENPSTAGGGLCPSVWESPSPSHGSSSSSMLETPMRRSGRGRSLEAIRRP